MASDRRVYVATPVSFDMSFDNDSCGNRVVSNSLYPCIYDILDVLGRKMDVVWIMRQRLQQGGYGV
jgi:hypothetical protein